MSNIRTYQISEFVNGYDAGQIFNIISISGLSYQINNLTDDTVTCTMTFDGNLVTADDVILNNIVSTFTPIYGDGSNCWIYQHTAAANTAGGSLTASQWNTRVLNNTLHQNGQPVQLGTNLVKMFPGTYEFYLQGVTANVGDYQIRLRDTTHGTTLFQGMSNTSGTNNGNFFTFGWFTIDQYSEIEIQQYCHSSDSEGMGKANVDGLPNMYLQFKIVNS